MSIENQDSNALVTFNKLESEIRTLLKESVQAMTFAYCPYSNFQVGASVLCGTGAIYTGCNVENSSYGLTICAERTALVKAISCGDRDIRAIAVCSDGLGYPASPCGACRQFIIEFSTDRDIVLYLTNSKMDKIKQTTIHKLLPDHFSLKIVFEEKGKYCFHFD